MNPTFKRSEPSNWKVLVVDDEESVRTFMTRALVAAGYEVTAAADGPEALQIALAHGPFDLFVLDFMLPMMNGDEVARLLRRIDPDAKILYVTGYSDRLFRKMPTLGANEAYVDKPTNIRALLQAVSLLLFGKVKP